MKRAIALILLLAMLFSFTSCKGLGAIGDISKAVAGLQGLAADMEKYEKMAEKLTNFKIVIETTNNDGSKEQFTEMRCDKGHMFMGNDYIYFTDVDAKKTYTLVPSEKSGYVMEYSGDDSSSFGSFTYGFLFFASAYRFIGAEKGGSEKINGRKATYYTAAIDNESIKFWVDEEYGITVKYNKTTKYEDGTEYKESMEVTEFKTGSVKVSDMVNVKDYEITDFNNFADGWGD